MIKARRKILDLAGGSHVAIAAIGVALAVWASPAAGQQLNVQTFTNSDGLAQQNVLAVHQDRTGYLWLGTFGGASRFDGRRFRTFTLADGLRSNAVHDYAEDRHGHLWAATESGLCRFDGERFHCVGREIGLPSDEVRSLAADPLGGLWAATAGGLVHLTKNGLRVYTAADGLPAADCLKVSEDPRGTVWVGTTSGLARLAGEGFVPVAAATLGRSRVAVLLPTARGLVVGTVDAGAYLLVRGELRRLDLPPPLAGAEITGAALEPEGHFWLTTSEGAVHFQGGHPTAVTQANGLPTKTIPSIDVDREGNVWIGTAEGVSRLVPGPLLGFTEAQGLPHRFVRGLARDERGRLWIGMPHGGLAIYENGRLRPLFDQRQEGPLGVYVLAKLQDGRMLAGTTTGLAVFEGERLARLYGPADGIPDPLVSSLAADAGGAWLGTSRGLARWENGRILAVTDPGLQGLAVVALALDARGRLWIGLRSGGIVIYDGHRVERLSAANGLTDTTVRDLSLHRDGSMWVGSSGEGAFRVQDGNIRRFSQRDGLVDGTVWAILCDRRGDVWLYTSHGLDRFDGRRFRHYRRGDGLVFPEGSTGAAWEDGDGNLWFGAGAGLVHFMPQEERRNPVAPRVVIEQVESVGLGHLKPGAHIPPGGRLVTFRFAALSYRNPEAVRYRYRIVGLHDRWLGPTPEPSVGVGSLPHGSYVFEVTGSNDEGVYSPVPARFSFVVDPFAWQTWWFRLSAAAAMALLLLAVFQWRTRKLQVDRRRLEAAVAARTAELARMNERLEELATTDELTGLANRRHFHQNLEAQLRTLSRARPAQSLSLLLLDVDHFKQVNDLHGHPAGDDLLVGLADRLRQRVRTNDLVARYGGEEFAVVLPATDRAGAAAIARGLHAAVRDRRFDVNGRQLRITLSIGVSTVKMIRPDTLGIADRLLREADEALYRAKGDGRDRVVAAGPSIVTAASAG